MSPRFTVTMLLALAPVVLLAQPAKEQRPDLSGTWSFSTLTALERPAEFAGKEFLTEAEAAAFAKRTMERNNRDNRDPSNREADVGGAYNEFWWDRGTTVALVGGKYRTSLIVDPPDGRLPALTAQAQERAAARAAERRAHPADGPEDRSLGERCLMFNAGPPMLPGPYNNFMQIIQTRDHVVIYNEMIHDARVIPLDGRPHAAAPARFWLGDSRGRWEGQTLVVDTTNFTDKTNFRGSGRDLHLIERFTRTDAGALLYEFRVDDPSSFVKPWSAALPMRKRRTGCSNMPVTKGITRCREYCAAPVSRRRPGVSERVRASAVAKAARRRSESNPAPDRRSTARCRTGRSGPARCPRSPAATPHPLSRLPCQPLRRLCMCRSRQCRS